MSKSTKPRTLRRIEDCMNKGWLVVNEQGQLVMTHPESFTKTEVELLIEYFRACMEGRQ